MRDQRLELLETQCEYAELGLKIEKLRWFIDAFEAAVNATDRKAPSLLRDGWRFQGVTITHKRMLDRQFFAMIDYRSVLCERIVYMTKAIKAENQRAKK